eukprot:224041_1
MFSGINRLMMQHVADWKRDNMDRLHEIDIPDWVTNIPQIDIENDPQLIEVRGVIGKLRERCLFFRGNKGKKCQQQLNADQLCYIAANIWDRAFAGVDNKDDWTKINYEQINPSNLTAALIFSWHIYKTGRGGGSARDIQWDRDIDFSTVPNGYISIHGVKM